MQQQKLPLPIPSAAATTISKNQSDDSNDWDDDNFGRRFPEILLVDERLRVMRSTYLQYLRHHHHRHGNHSTGFGMDDEKPTPMASSGGSGSRLHGNNKNQIYDNTVYDV